MSARGRICDIKSAEPNDLGGRPFVSDRPLEIVLIISPTTANAMAPHARGSWVMFVQVNPPSSSYGPIWIEGSDGREIGAKLTAISRFNAFPTTIIGLIETTTPNQLVGQLDDRFANDRLHDRWYTWSADLLAFVQAHGQKAISDLLAQTHPGGLSQTPVDIEEMAKILGVSSRTVRRMVADQQIPCMRSGRILRFIPSEVIASLQQRQR